jgi:thiamine-phosphate pyrophosphorylase
MAPAGTRADDSGPGFRPSSQAGRRKIVKNGSSVLLLPRLYAILDVDRMAARPVASICGTLLDAGVRLFQYRDKRASSRRMFEAVSRLTPMIRERGGRLIVNDRADVALVTGADGVHVGQNDLPIDLARRLLGSGPIVGCSTHNLEQLRLADGSSANYVAFGPIFATTSKETPDPVVGLDGLRQARQATAKTLVAIGGITAQNARQAIDCGANSVAVISGLLDADDLAARALELMEAVGA